MAKNQSALTGPAPGPTARRSNQVVNTGMQNNNAMDSPDSKASNKTPNLTARNQRRSGSDS